MFKFFYILPLVVLLCISCEKEKDVYKVIDTVPLYPHGNVLRYYTTIATTPDTIFSFSSGATTTLRSNLGVVLEIDAFSFATSSGVIVDSSIRVHWTEIRKIHKQIAHRLSMRSETNMILPQVIYSLSADLEGEKLVLVKPILIKWPADQVVSSLKAYYGTRPTTHTFFWAEAPSASVSVSSWIDPVNGAGVNGYYMVVDDTGYGCAGQAETLPSPGNGADLGAQFYPAYTAQNTAVYYLQSGSNRALALDDTGSGKFVLPQLAFGSTGRLFSITEAVENSYFSSWEDVTFLSPGLQWAPRPTKKELVTLQMMLQSL